MGASGTLAYARHDSGLQKTLAGKGIQVGNDIVVDPLLQSFGMPPEAIVVGGDELAWTPAHALQTGEPFGAGAAVGIAAQLAVADRWRVTADAEEREERERNAAHGLTAPAT